MMADDEHEQQHDELCDDPQNSVDTTAEFGDNRQSVDPSAAADPQRSQSMAAWIKMERFVITEWKPDWNGKQAIYRTRRAGFKWFPLAGSPQSGQIFEEDGQKVTWAPTMDYHFGAEKPQD